MGGFFCRCTQEAWSMFSITVKNPGPGTGRLGERRGKERGLAGGGRSLTRLSPPFIFFDRSDGEKLALGPRRQSASVCPVGSFNLPYTQHSPTLRAPTHSRTHTQTHTSGARSGARLKPRHLLRSSQPAGSPFPLSLPPSPGPAASPPPRRRTQLGGPRSLSSPWGNAGGRARRRAVRVRG